MNTNKNTINEKAKYGQCIVARITIAAPSFTFFVAGNRWHRWLQCGNITNYINAEFLKRGTTVLSVGAADGASAFLKAMMNGSTLFTKAIQNNVPTSWSFYFMSSFCESHVCLLKTISIC